MEELIRKESQTFENKFCLFIIAAGPYFLFTISGLIGKIAGFPWMEQIIHNNLMVPIGVILMVYAFLTAIETVKRSVKEKKSGVNVIPYPKVWVPIVIWISILTSTILFITSMYETLIDIWPEFATWYPSGWLYLGYLIGLCGPVPSIMIFSPSILKKVFSCKRNVQN